MILTPLMICDVARTFAAAYNPLRKRPRDTPGLTKNLRLRADCRWYRHWDPRILTDPERAEPQQFADKLTRAAKYTPRSRCEKRHCGS